MECSRQRRHPLQTNTRLNKIIMAIYFSGKSICPICHEVLETDQKTIGFPAFVANPSDPLIFFNDGAFHQKCLLDHPSGLKAIRLLDSLFFKTRPENRLCDIGKNIIKDPDDHIFIPLLTSNEQEGLYKFNFMNIDKNNIKNWEQRDMFIELAKSFKSDGKWVKGDYLTDLIAKIENATIS